MVMPMPMPAVFHQEIDFGQIRSEIRQSRLDFTTKSDACVCVSWCTYVCVRVETLNLLGNLIPLEYEKYNVANIFRLSWLIFWFISKVTFWAAEPIKLDYNALKSHQNFEGNGIFSASLRHRFYFVCCSLPKTDYDKRARDFNCMIDLSLIQKKNKSFAAYSTSKMFKHSLLMSRRTAHRSPHRTAHKW